MATTRFPPLVPASFLLFFPATGARLVSIVVFRQFAYGDVNATS